MALRLHSVALRQTSFVPHSVSATPALLRRHQSCVSPPFKQYCTLQVLCAAGFKESEVQSVKPPAKHDEKELPPLLTSMAITGLPPCQECMHTDEALAFTKKGWPSNWLELESFYQVCTSYVSFAHPSTVSHDRLAVIATICALLTILDDALDSTRSGLFVQKLGIDCSALDNRDSIREYIHSLGVVLRQDEPPQNPSLMHQMMWKQGCALRELSNLEWSTMYVDAILFFLLRNLESYSAERVGDHRNITDTESYTQMRRQTTGGRLDNLAVELCNNLYLPTEIREHPVVEKLGTTAWTYSTYANDIFSYSKERDEPHSQNIIKVLMNSEGMSLPQAAWKAVDLANSVANSFMELETQLPISWEDEPWGSDVRCYVQGLKEAMSGKLYWYSLQKRYRHPTAPFPELRDCNVSFTPRAEHFNRV